MSLQSTYESVKGLIAENLTSMGVEASSSDGLTTLAGKILDIEPSIGGLDLDTAVTLSVSSSTVVLGSSITCTATLTAEYDDETLVDVDLHGVLQNATIKLYESSTLMTSATTNANGVATLTYTPTSSGTKTIKVVFDGTENFNDCESATQTITVTQPTVGSIDLVSDKSILSYADGDTATLTATVYDDSASALPIEGVTVSFYVDGSEFIGTGVTDSNGEATETLYSHGDGDISVTAQCSNVSDTLTIEDCIKYDSTTYSSNKVYNLQLSSSKYSLEFDMLKKGTSDGSAGGMVLGTDSTYFMVGCGSSTSYQVARWGTNLSYVNLFSLTHNTWKTIRLEVDGSTVDIKADGNTYTVTGISSDITSLLYRINCNNTNINIKNLKIKPLNALKSDKSVLSYADSDTATLSFTHPLGTGQTVKLYDASDDSLITTISDNNDGVYTTTYSSTGAGDVGFYVKSGNIITDVCTIEDCMYYSNSYSKIKSDCTSNVISDRTLYGMTTNYQSDVELTFKLKDNVPTAFGVGFGDAQNIKVKFMPFKVYAYSRYWHIFYSTNSSENKMDDGGSVLSNSTVNSVFKLTTENLHGVYLYVDDTVVGYRDTKTSFPLNIRIDDFTASPLNLEYLKIKPL